MDELLTRGVERIYPSREELAKVLATGKKLKIYLGIDPTGPSLHIGNAVSLLKLREFQNEGHEIIILIGDFTAMIGDPTDKKAARVKLTREQVQDNLKSYREQIGRVLDLEKTKFVFNSEWLGKLNFAEIVELASEFTVGQMIERDMFQERIKSEQPIYLHEFLYPLMQGYDSVVLDVDMEIGGNDQTFNMLAGRTMLKRRGKEKFVWTNKLLVDPTGKKMGKTEGNMVTLADEPGEMYGKVMSWPDSLMPLGFEICTRLALEQMLELVKADPKKAKMTLAREIVRIYCGDEEAKKAEENFVSTFSKKEIPEEMGEVKIEKGASLADGLVAADVVKSKSEFRRLLDEGAIYNLDQDEKVTDPNFVVMETLRLRVGKKRFIKLVI